MKPKIALIGAGNIGRELYRKIRTEGWSIECAIDVDGIWRELPKKEKLGEQRDYKRHIEQVNLAFLAIPTFDNGQTAFRYIKDCLEYNVPVVTCEKGALSNHFTNLERDLREGRIGYSATVGGGTRLLKYLEGRVGQQVQEIHAVVNGTLNYILDAMSNGKSLGEAVEDTIRLGYAEPGTKHPIDVINKEATGDVRMKSAILFNICNLAKRRIKASEIRPDKIEVSELGRLNRECQDRRYIVSFTKDINGEEDVIWGFRHHIGEWHISAGFKHIKGNPLFRKLIPNGVDNAVLVSEGEFGRDGTYVLSGPGAGPGPTTTSMMIDAKNILSIAR